MSTDILDTYTSNGQQRPLILAGRRRNVANTANNTTINTTTHTFVNNNNIINASISAINSFNHFTNATTNDHLISNESTQSLTSANAHTTNANANAAAVTINATTDFAHHTTITSPIPPLPTTSTGEPTFSSSRLLDRGTSFRLSGAHVVASSSHSSDSAASLTTSPSSPHNNTNTTTTGIRSVNSSINSSGSSGSSGGGGSYAAIYQAKQQRRAGTAATPSDKVVVTSVSSSTSSTIGAAAADTATTDGQMETDNEVTTSRGSRLSSMINNDDNNMNGNNNNNTNVVNYGRRASRPRIAAHNTVDDDNDGTTVTMATMITPSMPRESSGDDAYAADFEDFDDDKTLLGVAPSLPIGSLPPASPEVPAHTLASHSSINNDNINNNHPAGRPQTDRFTMHKALVNLKSKSKSKGNLSRANSAQPARRSDPHGHHHDYMNGVGSRPVDALPPMMEQVFANDSPKSSAFAGDDSPSDPITPTAAAATANELPSSATATGGSGIERTTTATRRRIIKKGQRSAGTNDNSNAFLSATSSPYDVPPNVGPTGAHSVPPSPAAKPISGPSASTHHGFGGSSRFDDDDEPVSTMSDAERARQRLERLADRDLASNHHHHHHNNNTNNNNPSSGKLRPPRFDLADASPPSDQQISPVPGGIIKRGASPQPRGRVRFAAADQVRGVGGRSPSRDSPHSPHSPNDRYHDFSAAKDAPFRSISLPQNMGALPPDARDRASDNQPSSARTDIGVVNPRAAAASAYRESSSSLSIGPLSHDETPVGPSARRRKSAHPVLIHDPAAAATAAANDLPNAPPPITTSISQPTPSARRGRRASVSVDQNATTASTGGSGTYASYNSDEEDHVVEQVSSANAAATAMTPKHGVHRSAPSPGPRTRGVRGNELSAPNTPAAAADLAYRTDRAAELAAFGGRESRTASGAVSGRRGGNADDIPVGPRRSRNAPPSAAAGNDYDLGVEPMQLPMSAARGRRGSVPNAEYGSYTDDNNNNNIDNNTNTNNTISSYAEAHQQRMEAKQRKVVRKKVVGDIVKGSSNTSPPPISPNGGEYKTSSLFTTSVSSATPSSSVVSSTAHVGSTTVIPDNRRPNTKKALRHPHLSDEDNSLATPTPTALNTNLDSPPQGGHYRSPTADRTYHNKSSLDPYSAYRSNGSASAMDMELESVPSSSLPPSPKPHGLHPSAYQISTTGSAGGPPPPHPRVMHGHHHSISEPISPPMGGGPVVGSGGMTSVSSTAATPTGSGMPPPHRRIRPTRSAATPTAATAATASGEGFSAGAPVTPSSGNGAPPMLRMGTGVMTPTAAGNAAYFGGGAPSPSSINHGERALSAAARAINPYANIPSTPGGTMMSSTPAVGVNEPRTPANRARVTAGRRVSVSQSGMDSGRSEAGTGIPADYKGNDADYIPSSELKPCRSPKDELKQAFIGIKSSDWSVRFNAINTLRHLAVHHTDQLIPHCRAAVRDLRPEVDSLRSSLAKNAMMCLCDLFTQCKKNMDCELVAIVPSLLRRAGEATGFLAEEGCRALEEMIRGTSESKSLAILITHAGNGNKVIKQMAAVFLDKAVEVLGSRVVQSKEYPSLIKTIGILFTGASAPMRVAARNSVLRLAKLVGVIELETALKRALTAQQFNPIKKVLDQGVNQDLNLGGPPVARVRAATAKRGARRVGTTTGTTAAASAAGGDMDDGDDLAVGGLGYPGSGVDDPDDIGAASADFTDVQSFPPRGNVEGRGTQSSYSDPGSSLSVRSTTSYKSGLGSLRAAAGRNMFEKKIPARTGEEVEQLASVFTEMAASDFRQRANGIQRLLAFVEAYPDTANDQVGRLFDQFLPRLADSNSKVQLAALAAMEKLVPALKDNMTAVVQLLVPALANNLASTNAAVKKATQETMSLVMMSLDETVLLQSFAAAVTFGNARVKPVMIEKLDELSARVYRSKPGLVTRHVIPVAFALIDDSKPDIRVANRRLLQRLHSLLGDTLLDPSLTAKLSPAAVAKIKAALSSTSDQ